MSQILSKGGGGITPGMFVETLTGNIGVASPDLMGNINVVTSNGSPVTIGAGDTLTLNFAGAPGETSLIIGTDPGSLGPHNLSLLLGLLITDNGASNTVVGSFANIAGTRNTVMGMNGVSNGDDNSVFGYNSGIGLGSNNSVFGSGARASRSNNVAIGYQAEAFGSPTGDNIVIGAGSQITGNNNIVMGVSILGTTSDAIIIGNNTQLSCNISGIYNTTPNTGYQVVVADSTDKISTVAGGTFLQSISGNTGTAVPDGTGDINIITANSTPIFAAATNTVTLDFALTTNLALGSSLPALAGGTQNVAFGPLGLAALTSGTGNSSVGYEALTSATTVGNATGLGFNAGANLQSGGNFAVAVGALAMSRCVSSGEYNIGIGARAADLLSGSARYNIGIGGFALLGGNSNTTGNSNIAIGYTAGQFITSGSSNIAIGTQSIFSNPNDMTGSFNVAVGENSLEVVTSGNNNTALGVNTLSILSTGSGNVAIGYGSGPGVTTIADSISIGYQANSLANDTISIGRGSSASGGGNAIAIGLGNVSSDVNSISIGASCSATALAAIAIGVGCTASGIRSVGVGPGSTPLADNGIAIGYASDVRGVNSIALGASASSTSVNVGSIVIGSLASDGGDKNIVIGYSAGTALNAGGNIVIDSIGIAGTNNISIGTNQTTCNIAGIYGATPAAGYLNVVVDSANKLSTIPAGSLLLTLSGNTGTATPDVTGDIDIVTANSTVTFVAAGNTLTMDFLASSTVSTGNLGLGTDMAGATGANNVAVGTTVFVGASSGDDNTAIGSFCMYTNPVTGNQNTAVGTGSMYQVSSGFNNTAVGGGSLTVTSGSGNCAFGNQAGNAYSSTESNNICIGDGVVGTALENNVIRIGNGAVVETHITGIYATAPGATYQVVVADTADKLSTIAYTEWTAWTPTVEGATTAGATTYTLQQGIYNRIGNTVTIQFNVSYSAATGTGTLLLRGLPINVGFIANYIPTGCIYITGAVAVAGQGYNLGGFSNTDSCFIVSSSVAGVGAVLQIANSATQLVGSLTYSI